MEACDELDKEEELDKDDEEANLALMSLTSSNIKFDSDFGSYSEE